MSVCQRINPSDADWAWWKIQHQVRVEIRTIEFEAEGLLYKEDRKVEIQERTYHMQAHAEDTQIQNHRTMSSLYYPGPYSYKIDNLESEITVGIEVNFRDDGTADATVETRQIPDEWETVKLHRPTRLDTEAAE